MNSENHCLEEIRLGAVDSVNNLTHQRECGIDFIVLIIHRSKILRGPPVFLYESELTIKFFQ